MLFENNPSVQAFFISIKAGGTGLNLTAADYVFILDPWWNPSTEQQAIARAHRIGQEKSVMALKFITRESIEEKILHLQEKKSQLAEDILSGTGKYQLDRNELNFLFS
jgi:non-specific serine/threonine protein kinase